MLRHVFVLVAVSVASASAATQAAEAARTPRRQPLPSWEKIAHTVSATLAKRDGYRSGDLLAKSDVQPVLAHLDKLGWGVPDASKLLAMVPGDDEFMVKNLRAKDGQRFMRNVASYPDGYDRVDRFLKLPRSETMLADLITNPGGFELFKYMAEAPGGIEMGKMLGDIPSGAGKNFNKSTGRIYTEQELLSHLKTRYEQTLRAEQHEKR